MCQFTNHSLSGEVVFRAIRVVREGPATAPYGEDFAEVAKAAYPAGDLPNLPTAEETIEGAWDAVGKLA